MRFFDPNIFGKPVFSDGVRTSGTNAPPLLWSSPISQNPEIDAVEIWVGPVLNIPICLVAVRDIHCMLLIISSC